MENKVNDRVSYSLGSKINLGNYESLDFHLSYSTDVKPGESHKEALLRAQRFVEKEAEKKLEELKGK